MALRTCILLIAFTCSYAGFSQERITGFVLDSKSRQPLAYVNIGIRETSVGAVSIANGSFSIDIPSDHLNDTITFSMVGYHELTVPIYALVSENKIAIRLIEKVTALNEFVILGDKFVQKKYGIKKRGLVHFTDGIFKEHDSFEIGQLINLGSGQAQITSVNLHVNSSRPDSASFRINFYRYDEDDNRPRERIIEKSIFQRHAIQEGWLKFDVKEYNVLLKGKVVVTIEFIPESKEGIKQVLYEVKIGGTSKSFYRRNSLGQWNLPPHHYCIYVTALAEKNAPEEGDDKESVPVATLKSTTSKEPFSIFVRLPKDYQSAPDKKYPVVYHLDGNAYFDPVSSSVDQLKKNKKISSDAIVVGIGYENAYVMDSLRDRDYTFPEAHASDSFHTSGGGDRFYDFLKTVLQPYIEKTYRTDTTNRTIMGHSLGGYFVLYALLRSLDGDALFNNYVAASPSISYQDGYIIEQFQNLAPINAGKNRYKLYISVGEMEIAEDPTGSFRHFGQILSNLNLVLLKVKVYDNLEHLGTAVPSFEDGLEFILSN